MAQRLETLALFPGDPPPPRSEPDTSVSRKHQLWIAACFPRLALESLVTAPSERAIVVTEIWNGCAYVVAADDKAISLGIKPGIKLSAALALSDTLDVLPRRIEAERTKLETLAGHAMQFSPIVSLEPPAAVLVDVSGSLKLFGGVKVIKDLLAAVLRQQQVTTHLCIAPTTFAALWLARCGKRDVLSHEELIGSLSSVPLDATEWPEKTRILLRGMGIRNVGDCMRLPRDGFARRVGRRYLQELDKSRGACDPRLEFEPPIELDVHYELSDETVDVSLLVNIGKKLIARMVQDLRKRQIRAPWFECVLHHLDRGMTSERIHFSDPTCDEDRFVRLFADRLEHISLASSVIALSLKAGPGEPASACSGALFGNRGPSDRETDDGLIERLRGRFGIESLYSMVLVDEHRPEAAWAKSGPFSRQERRPPLAVGLKPSRPLWLLPEPERLSSTSDNCPCYENREPLRIKHGPERIESGWWDGGEIGRDYYIASSIHGERLWVFQSHCSGRGWYLHGFFG